MTYSCPLHVPIPRHCILSYHPSFTYIVCFILPCYKLSLLCLPTSAAYIACLRFSIPPFGAIQIPSLPRIVRMFLA